MSHSWFHWKGSNQMTNSDLVRELTEIMDRVVKQLKQSRIPIVNVRWNSWISSSFHQYHFRDQHKLNFGTKFLLEGKNVTTHHFRSFLKLLKNTIYRLLFTKTLFIILLLIVFYVRLIFWETFEKFIIHWAVFISGKVFNNHLYYSFHRKFSLRVFRFAKPDWFRCEFTSLVLRTFHTE